MKLENNIKHILFCLFLVFAFFPYVKIIGFGNTTVQPTGLFFSFFPLLLLKKEKLPAFFFYLVFIALITLLFVAEVGLNFTAIRDWINYFALASVSIASYKLLIHLKGDFYKVFKICTYIWLSVALVHYFINPTFLSFLMSNHGGALSGGRGVTSLSTEPSYYGLMMLAFFAIYLINSWHKRSKFLGIVIVFQLFFLSRASTALVAFLLAIGIYLLTNFLRFRLKVVVSIAFTLALSASIIYLGRDSIKESRVGEVGQIIINNPEKFIGTDYSINSRFLSVVLPFISMYENNFLPRGFSKYSTYYKAKLEDSHYSILFVNPGIRGAVSGYTSKSESGYGKTFFELGFLGVGIFVFLTMSMWSSIKSDTAFLFGFLLFNACMLMAFPWTTPVAPFIIGNLFYIKYKRNQIRKDRKKRLRVEMIS